MVSAELLRVQKANGGTLKSSAVVDAARPRGAPLHRFFEWSDNKAAEKWRLAQAGQLIQSVAMVVIRSGKPRTMTQFVNVRSGKDDGDTGRCYMESKVVLTREDLRQQVLEAAAEQVLAWKRRHEMLREYFSGTFKAIEVDVDRVEQRKRKRATV